MTMRKMPYLIITLLVLGLDQLTKELISRSLYLHETRSVIPGFFNLVYTGNTGAVFGIFQGVGLPYLRWILISLSFAALALVAVFFARVPADDRLNLVGFSLVLGGALGNIVDRIARESVVDFLEFYVRDYRWPAFNVADSAICIGIAILVWRSFRDGRDPLAVAGARADTPSA